MYTLSFVRTEFYGACGVYTLSFVRREFCGVYPLSFVRTEFCSVYTCLIREDRVLYCVHPIVYVFVLLEQSKAV